MRLFLFIACVFMFPGKVVALEFSEIAYDIVGADDGCEWVELHNESSTPVDVTGYYFTDSSNHQLAKPPEKGSQGSLTLPADGYLILADNASLFLSQHPGYSGTVVDTTMSLSNYSSSRTEPIKLQLLDSNKNPVSEAVYLPSPKGERGYTLELNTDLQWVDSTAIGGSPGAIRPPPPPPAQLASVHISEIVSNPQGADADAEVVELYNADNVTVLLSDWYITDKPTASGSVNRHSLQGLQIGPGDFLVIRLKGSFLNNANESVSLYGPDDRLVENIELSGKAPEGQSYAYIDSLWRWTDQLTLGSANKGSVVIESGSGSSALARQSASANSPPPPSVIKRNSTVVSSPSVKAKSLSSPSAGLSATLPTGLATVAGIDTTEPPLVLWRYLTAFGPPFLLIGGLAFYLYKKKLLFFKERHVVDSQSVVEQG